MFLRLAVYLFSAVALMAQTTPTRWERSAEQKRALNKDGSPVKSVTYLSPDTDDPQPIEFCDAQGRVSFTVPATRIYGLVVIAEE